MNKILKMKILANVQKHFEEIGFGASDRPFCSHHHFRGVFISISATTLQFLYLLYDAKSTQEYMLSFFMIMVSVFLFIIYFSTIFNIKKLNDLIHGLQLFIDESKWSVWVWKSQEKYELKWKQYLHRISRSHIGKGMP